MKTTMKTLLATSVALTMGAASANIFNTPAFPTVEAGSHTASTMEYYDAAVGGTGYESLFTAEQVATLANGVTITSDANNTDVIVTIGDDYFTLDDTYAGSIDATFDLDIESTNEWYKHGSGSSDLGNGYSFSLGYGQTDVSVGLNATGTIDGVTKSIELDSADFGLSDQVTNVTVGINKVVWADSDEAIVVGANYGTESNLSVGTAYQKNIMVGEGMIQAGVSAGHNVDSGITGFGYMAGYDAGVQAVGFDGIYGGFSVTDGLMTVGIVDVDTDGTRHNLTLNPIGILINLLMGNDTVLNHNFNK